MGYALAQLQQALAVAAQYQLSAWRLRMHFVEAILTAPISLEGADGALEVRLQSFLATNTPCSYAHPHKHKVWPE